MTSPVQEDDFERMLADLSLDPVADEGFSERLMRQLPKPPRQRHTLPLLALIAGGVLAGVQLSGSAWLTGASHSLQQGLLGGAGGTLLVAASVLGLGAALWALLESA